MRFCNENIGYMTELKFFAFIAEPDVLKKFSSLRASLAYRSPVNIRFSSSKQLRKRKFSIKLGVVILKVVKSTIYIASVLHQPR